MLRGHGNSTKRRNEKKTDKTTAPIAFTAVVKSNTKRRSLWTVMERKDEWVRNVVLKYDTNVKDNTGGGTRQFPLLLHPNKDSLFEM